MTPVNCGAERHPLNFGKEIPLSASKLASSPPIDRICRVVAALEHFGTVGIHGVGGRAMKFLRIYLRVLQLLGPEKRLAWVLALAGVALAAANFVEPILFGRIIDSLANVQGGDRKLDWPVLMPLVTAWVGFGLFIIVASTVVSLYADRLSHRHYPGGARRLFRAHPAIAAELPHRDPFRSIDEGDDHRHQYALGHVAVVLSRALHQPGHAVHPDAADRVLELALCTATDGAGSGLCPVDRVSCCARPKSCRAQSRLTTPTLRSARPTHSAISR